MSNPQYKVVVKANVDSPGGSSALLWQPHNGRDPHDGGCAFPFVSNGGVGEHQYVSAGMSLLDWFAGQALAGILANQELLKMLEVTLKSTPERNSAASYAYAIAESMLKERSQS